MQGRETLSPPNASRSSCSDDIYFRNSFSPLFSGISLKHLISFSQLPSVTSFRSVSRDEDIKQAMLSTPQHSMQASLWRGCSHFIWSISTSGLANLLFWEQTGVFFPMPHILFCLLLWNTSILFDGQTPTFSPTPANFTKDYQVPDYCHISSSMVSYLTPMPPLSSSIQRALSSKQMELTTVFWTCKPFSALIYVLCYSLCTEDLSFYSLVWILPWSLS